VELLKFGLFVDDLNLAPVEILFSLQENAME